MKSNESKLNKLALIRHVNYCFITVTYNIMIIIIIIIIIISDRSKGALKRS